MYRIKPAQINEWRRAARDVGGPWQAVAESGDPEAATWTLSRNDDPGWRTDGVFPGYGMKEDEARYAALAMTSFPLLLDEIARLQNAACPHCGTLVNAGSVRKKKPGREAEIRMALAEGQTASDLVRAGYKKSTVYKAARSFYGQFQQKEGRGDE